MNLPSFLEVRDTGGTKGRGVFARKLIPSGTVVLSAAHPVVFVPREDPTCPGVSSASPEATLKSSSRLSLSDAPGRRSALKHSALRPTPCARCLQPVDHDILRHASGGQARPTQSSDSNAHSRSGTALRCSRCKCTYYCSAACQRAAWSEHKTECEIFKELFEWSGGFFPTPMQRLVIKCLLHGIDLSSYTAGPDSSLDARPSSPSAEVATSRLRESPGESSEDSLSRCDKACSISGKAVGDTSTYPEGEALTNEVDGSTAVASTSSIEDCTEEEPTSDGQRQCADAKADLGGTVTTAFRQTSCVCWDQDGGGVPLPEVMAQLHEEMTAFAAVFRTAVGRVVASKDACSHAGSSTLPLFAEKLNALPQDELMVILLKLSRNVFSILSGEAPRGCNSGGSCVCCLANSVCGQGLYGPPVCYVNHRCDYNLRAIFGGSCRASLRLISVRDIVPGEEVCVSYVPRTQCSRDRRRQLLRDYGFLCCCPLCCSCPGNSHDAAAIPRTAYLEEPGISAPRNAPREKAGDKQHGSVGARKTPTSELGDETHRKSNQRRSRVGGNGLPLCQAFDAQLVGLFCSSPACRALNHSSEANALSALEDAFKFAVDESLKARSIARDQDSQSTSCSETEEGTEASRIRVCDDAYGKEIRLGLPVLGAQNNAGYPCGLSVSAMKPGRVPLTCMQCKAVLGGDHQQALAGAVASLPKLAQGLASSAGVPALASIRLFFSAYQVVFAHTHPGNLMLLNIRARLLPVVLGEPALYVPWTLLLVQHQAHAAGAIHGAASPEAAEELETAGRLLLFVGQGQEAEAERAWHIWNHHPRAGTGQASKNDRCTNGSARMRTKVLRCSFECLRRAYSVHCLFYGGSAARSRAVEELICQCSRELGEYGETVPELRDGP
ncbi:histone lysine set [Cystoisospora suis]|uniref:Histone lysine set n=1 Tax=Cystoisospora suis TaxID=483139 RepID=A0A2C6LE94_9APIC|nr:histone lysine set [Cystoisospora suis]